MKFVSKCLVLFATLILLAPVLAKSDKHCHEEVVKFVQATASPNGNGSKKHPFATLAAAALATWDVLIVLPSTKALEGGLTLKPGQKIIGSCDPTDISLSPAQPIITTSSTSPNNGVGITATGDNVIKNLYFQNTWSSAINYDNATNLTIQDCLITGHNQGSTVITTGFFTGALVGGIQGQCSQSGETRIEHVIIRNNHAGPGIQDLPVNPAHRELTVCKCELAQLNTTGILSDPVGSTTTVFSSVVVKDSYLHDFIGNTGIGFLCFPHNGSVQTVLIKDSAFSNINDSNIEAGPAFFTTNAGPSPELKIEIDGCSFESSTSVAITIFNNNSSQSEAIVTNSTSNVSTFFLSQVFDNGIQQNRLCGNTVTGVTFYEAQASHSVVALPMPVEITEIIGNCFTGNIGIELLPLIKWTLLDITAECNCFYGSGTNSILFDTITSTPTPGAFNGLINAHDNTFSGFTTDIKDNGSNVSYLVSRNFWGTPTTTCSTTSSCLPFQTCDHGSCLGPIVVAPAPPFTGFIDASHPLAVSIKCPRNCCFSTSGKLTTPPLPQAMLSTEEKLQKLARISESIENRSHQPTAVAVAS